MAEKREQRSCAADVDDARLRAQGADEGGQLLERIAAPSPVGVSSHGRPLKRSGRACSRPPFAAPPSGWPPMNVNRGGSGRAASTIGALRAAGVGHDRGLTHVLVELVEQRDVLPDRRREDRRGRLRPAR